MSNTAVLTGNLSTEITVIGAGDRPGVKFRMAANERYRDRKTGEWTAGKTFWVDVVCWSRLADGVRGSLRRGDPVVVMGRLETDEYTPADGQRRFVNQLVASAVGHDLNWGTSQFRRPGRNGDRAQPEAATATDDPWTAGTEESERAEPPDFDRVGAATAGTSGSGSYSDD